MKIKVYAKDRLLLSTGDSKIRVEVDQNSKGNSVWNIYFPVNSTIHTSKELVVGCRKVTIKAKG